MFGNILIGVDGRRGGRDAIALAQQLAAPGGLLTLGHVYGNAMLSRGGALMLAVGSHYSDELLLGERDAASPQAERASVSATSVGRGLHDLAERGQADLLVIGTCSHGFFGRVLVGDETSASLNGAPCAVAIAPSGYAENAHRLVRIGVGHDDSPESARALVAARVLAERHRSSIIALSVVSEQSIPVARSVAGRREIAAALLAGERKRVNQIAGVTGDVVFGDPAEELIRPGENLDLLIVGSRGDGPPGRLFKGRTSNHLARRVHCPLLVMARDRQRHKAGQLVGAHR